MMPAPTTQQGSLPAGLDGGHVGRLDAGCPVADPVDAGVLDEEKPLLDSTFNLTPGYPGFEELLAGGIAMCAVGNPRELPLNDPVLLTHTVH